MPYARFYRLVDKGLLAVYCADATVRRQSGMRAAERRLISLGGAEGRLVAFSWLNRRTSPVMRDLRIEAFGQPDGQDDWLTADRSRARPGSPCSAPSVALAGEPAPHYVPAAGQGTSRANAVVHGVRERVSGEGSETQAA